MGRDVQPPAELYAKFDKMGFEPKDRNDVLPNLSGNPRGDKASWVSYIYAKSGESVEKDGSESLYMLKVTFRWPFSARMFDETAKNGSPRAYDWYKQRGYVGVVRNLRRIPTHVVFDPVYYVDKVFNTATQSVVYDRTDLSSSSATSAGCGLSDSTSDCFQSELNQLMQSRIGAAYIDPRRDAFCISEIARRRGLASSVVFSGLKKILARVSVDKSSGCWVSENTKDYTRTFWMSLGGLDFNDIFRFPHDLTDVGSEPPVIKNSSVLHHIICELTLKEDHKRCCRPSHLRLGTSMENAYHVKIRKTLEQFFDFTPDQLKQYVRCINTLAALLQVQNSTSTQAEAEIVKRNKSRGRKKVTLLEDDEGWGEFISVGDPHKGDTKDLPIGRFRIVEREMEMLKEKIGRLE